MTRGEHARSPAAPRGGGLRALLAVREFRGLWAALVLSAAGDRLALVALTLLVYDRTRSPFLSAVAYASGTVPYLAGGLALSGLADRLPRRGLMAGCDIARAALVAPMTWPGMPLTALIALLYLVTLIQPPFDAARSAITRDILPGDRYALGTAVMQMTFRIMIVAGAAAGGLAVTLAGARPALGADAVTFAASAVLVRCFVRPRPPAAVPARGAAGGGTRAGIRLVFGSPALRTVMLLSWIAAFYEVPEGLAAPYAAALGGGPPAVGLLIASGQLSAVLAAPLYTAVGQARRQRWIGAMAAVASGALTLAAFRPGLAASAAVFAVSGMFGVYQLDANTAFVERVPDGRRGQALGVAAAGLVAGQGLALAAAGWAAQETGSPAAVVAASGGIGAVLACLLAAGWRQAPRPGGRHARAPRDLAAAPARARRRHAAPAPRGRRPAYGPRARRARSPA